MAAIRNFHNTSTKACFLSCFEILRDGIIQARTHPHLANYILNVSHSSRFDLSKKYRISFVSVAITMHWYRKFIHFAAQEFDNSRSLGLVIFYTISFLRFGCYNFIEFGHILFTSVNYR